MLDLAHTIYLIGGLIILWINLASWYTINNLSTVVSFIIGSFMILWFLTGFTHVLYLIWS